MISDIEFTHAFQPIIDTETGKIISYEVLLRGPHNEPPGYVFNEVENNNMMEFDQKSREQAISLASQLGLDCSLNLNFTMGSILFDNGRYVEDTIRSAEENGLTAKQIVVEILESEIIDQTEDFSMVLSKLRRSGVTIAIDDFGSGYAGLNMLADILPDLIKLDIHLMQNIHQDGVRQSIVRAICSLCFDLGIDILAEGVEQKEEYDFLKKQGITIYQGWLFAKPGFESFPEASFPE
ncbi:MAG: EAL domain-containing protein [Candidatus Delongbacteria bacterium]|nr:EAL domain-containing protein [Candidatus Delongbacteria bacterium]